MEEQAVVWFVPAWVGETSDSPEPAPGHVFFFVQTDLESGQDFVPVFDEYSLAMNYIESISRENDPDQNIGIVQFAALESIFLIIQSQFKRTIPLRINMAQVHYQEEESDDETQSDSSSDG